MWPISIVALLFNAINSLKHLIKGAYKIRQQSRGVGMSKVDISFTCTHFEQFSLCAGWHFVIWSTQSIVTIHLVYYYDN